MKDMTAQHAPRNRGQKSVYEFGHSPSKIFSGHKTSLGQIPFSPLTLAFILAACGGGGGGGGTSAPETGSKGGGGGGGTITDGANSNNSFKLTGRLYNGPISGAKIYIDVNEDGKLDKDDDLLVNTTDAEGFYEGDIPKEHRDKNLIADLTGAINQGDDPNDDSDNEEVSGIWHAPGESKVISPLTHYLVVTKGVVGLDGLTRTDVLTRDPFEETPDDTDHKVASLAKIVGEQLEANFDDQTGVLDDSLTADIEAAITAWNEDADHDPTAMELSSTAHKIDETIAGVTTTKTLLATITFTDADGLGENRIALDNDTLFEVEAMSRLVKKLYLKAGQTLDYETDEAIEVTLTGAGNNVATFTLNIGNLNDNAPTLKKTGDAGNLRIGTVDAATDTGLAFTLTDPDNVLVLDGFEITATDDATDLSSIFEVVESQDTDTDLTDGKSYKIIAKTGAVFDNSPISLTVTYDDGDHKDSADFLPFTPFNIVGGQKAEHSIAENDRRDGDDDDDNDNDILVTTMKATSSDITWHVTGGTERDNFEINTDTGALYFTGISNQEDGHAQAEHQVKIAGRKSTGASTEQTITVTITNIDEGDAAFTVNIDENDETLSLAETPDPDGVNATGYTYKWYRSDDRSITTAKDDEFIGEASTYTLTEEDEAHYIFAEISYTDKSGADEMVTSKISKKIPVAPVIAAGLTEVEIRENDALDLDPNNHISIPIIFRLDKGEDVVWTLIDDVNDSFSIDYESGKLTFIGLSDQDANNPSSYKITVKADNGRGHDTRPITVKIKNINDEIPTLATLNTQGQISTSANPNDRDTGLTFTVTDPDEMFAHDRFTLSGDQHTKFETQHVSTDGDVATYKIMAKTGATLTATPINLSVSYHDGRHDSSNSISFALTPTPPPMITNGDAGVDSYTIEEKDGQEIEIAALTAAGATPIRWSIIGGADRANFRITDDAGVLFFTGESDQDIDTANDTYEVQVAALNWAGASAPQTITVTIDAINDEIPTLDIESDEASLLARSASTKRDTNLSFTVTDLDKEFDHDGFSLTGTHAEKFVIEYDSTDSTGTIATYKIMAKAYRGFETAETTLTINYSDGTADALDDIEFTFTPSALPPPIHEHATPNADIFTGSDGVYKDLVNYHNSDTGVAINLADGTTSGVYAAGDTFISIESLVGSPYDDIFIGDAADNNLGGGAGDDILNGGAGSDTLSAHAGHDILIGGADEDFLYGYAGDDILFGGAGGDLLTGGAGDDIFILGDKTQGGADIVLDFSTGKDRIAIFTTTGSETTLNALYEAANIRFTNGDIYDTNGTDETHDDVLLMQFLGFTGALTIDMFLVMGKSDVSMPSLILSGVMPTTPYLSVTATASAETFTGAPHRDDDHVSYADSDVGVTIDLPNNTGTNGHAEGDKWVSIEHITGSDHNDEITADSINNMIKGRDGDDMLNGGDGDDTLYGGAGHDILNGGAGHDMLYGGAGIDRLEGGLGDDIFVLGAKLHGTDHVIDFSANDKIWLDALDAALIRIDTSQNYSGDFETGTNDADIHDTQIYHTNGTDDDSSDDMLLMVLEDFTTAMILSKGDTPLYLEVPRPIPYAALARGDDASLAGILTTPEDGTTPYFTIHENTDLTASATTPNARKITHDLTNDPAITATLTVTNAEGTAIPNHPFSLNTNTGAVSFMADTILDFESEASYKLTITLTQDRHTDTDIVFEVRVNNLNEAPASMDVVDSNNDSITTLAIDEGSSNQKLADVIFVDEDMIDGFRRNIATIPDNPIFEIRNGTELWLKASAELDYENAAHRSYEVRLTGTGGHSHDFTLTVNDINDEVPELVRGGNAGDLRIGTTTQDVATRNTGLTFTLTDADGGIVDLNNFRITSPDSNNQAGKFQVVASNNHDIAEGRLYEIHAKAEQIFDATAINLQVTYNDGVRDSNIIAFAAFTPTDSIAAPVIAGDDNPNDGVVNTASYTIPEDDTKDGDDDNNPNNDSLVTALSASGGGIKWSKTAAHDSADFRIHTKTGALYFVGTSDQDAKNSKSVYKVTVTASNDAGKDEQTITLHIDNINDEAPKLAAIGTETTLIAGTTKNVTDTGLTFTLTDADNLAPNSNGWTISSEDKNDQSNKFTIIEEDARDSTTKDGKTYKIVAKANQDISLDPIILTINYSDGAQTHSLTLAALTAKIPDAKIYTATAAAETFIGLLYSRTDHVSYEHADTRVAINLADGTMSGAYALGDQFTSIEQIKGSRYNDLLTGDAAANKLEGGAGNDILIGGGGGDNLIGGVGHDILIGGEGYDQLYGGAGDDILIGGAKFDILWGEEGDDIFILSDRMPNTALVGDFSSGADKIGIFTPTGSETTLNALYAAANIRVEILQNLNESYIYDTNGTPETNDDTSLIQFRNFTTALTIDDFLIMKESDFMPTLPALDERGTDAADSFTGRAYHYNDHISYAASLAGVTIDLSDTALESGGYAEGDKLVSIDHLTGSDYVDILTGSTGDNELKGEAGHDILSGGAGDDSLDGGMGEDILNGGAGHDRLTGGLGDDIFVLGDKTQAVNQRGVDHVTDFSDASNSDTEQDRIRIVTESGRENNSDAILNAAGILIVSDENYNGDFNSSSNDSSINDTQFYDSNGTIDTEDDVLLMVLEDFTFPIFQIGDLTTRLFYVVNKSDVIPTTPSLDATATAAAETFTGLYYHRDDHVSYADSDAGLDIKFTHGPTESGGYAEGDKLISIEHITGSAYDDEIWADSEDNILNGGAGNDKLYGGGSRGTITLESDNSGDDTLYGGAGDDLLSGFSHNDLLYGETGNDELYGAAGDDLLSGGAGDDLLDGGAGDDIFALGEKMQGVDHVTDFSTDDKIRIDTITGDEQTLTALYQAADIRIDNSQNYAGDFSKNWSNDANINDTQIYHTNDTASDTSDDILLMVLQDFTTTLTLDMFDII